MNKEEIEKNLADLDAQTASEQQNRIVGIIRDSLEGKGIEWTEELEKKIRSGFSN